MKLQKEFESLLNFGLQNSKNKKDVINMSAHLITYLNSTDKQELSKDDLDRIAGGYTAPTDKIDSWGRY